MNLISPQLRESCRTSYPTDQLPQERYRNRAPEGRQAALKRYARLMFSKSSCRSVVLAARVTGSSLLCAQTPALTPDIPPSYRPRTEAYEYVKRVAMIPMRDGVKLYTVIVVAK